MSALATPIAAARIPRASSVRGAVALAVWAALGLLWLAAATVLWRRMAGALVFAAPARVLLAAALPAALWAAFIHALLGVTAETWPSRMRNLAWWLPGGALALFAAALSLPHTGVWGWMALWSPLLAEEAWALWRWRQSPRASCGGNDAPDLLPADATQRFTRSVAADGSDRLCGRLRMTFAPGQRSMKADVAFCPPFAQAPELIAEVQDGPPARVKLLQALAYGARIDVRLVDLLEEPADVLVEFSACCPSAVAVREACSTKP